MKRTDVYVIAALLVVGLAAYAICNEMKRHTRALQDLTVALDCNGPILSRNADDCRDAFERHVIRAMSNANGPEPH